MPPTDPPAPRDSDRLILGGLLGLAVAGAFQLLDKKPTESVGLTVALYSFAASVPLLSASLINELVRSRQRHPPPVKVWRAVITLVSAAAAVVGLGAVFFHAHWLAGCLFIFCTLLSVVLVRTV
jgi:hypothetical protein